MELSEYLRWTEKAILDGDEAQARVILHKAQKDYPESVDVYLLFARVAEKREHAVYCLRTAKRLDPSNPEVNRLWSEIKNSGWGKSSSNLVNSIVGRLAER